MSKIILSDEEDRRIKRMLRAESTLIDHSMFAYPHLWLWHALFDGTRLCRCWRSRELKELRRDVG